MVYRFDGDRGGLGLDTNFVLTLDANGILRNVGRGMNVDLASDQYDNLSRYYIFTLTTDPPNAPAIGEIKSGSSPINLYSSHWKDPVPTTEYLPTVNNIAGDVRLVILDMALYGWNGNMWVALASGGLVGDQIVVPADIAAIANGNILLWDEVDARFEPGVI